MTKQTVIKALKNKDWTIRVSSLHELALVFNACLDAGICWNNGFAINRFFPGEFTTEICFLRFSSGITHGNSYSIYGQDLTKWFFEEVNND